VRDLLQSNPVILVLLGEYLPGYKAGGTIRSIANMVEALGDEFDFRIMTSDRDLGDCAPYDDIEPGEWLHVGKARVLYLPRGIGSLWRFIRTLWTTQADFLYLTGFFDAGFSILPLILRRLSLFRPNSVILAPCGEFSSGALSLKSRKKRAYIALSRWAGVYRGILWHASSSYEEQDIRIAFGREEAVTIASPIAAQTSANLENGVSGRSETNGRRVKPAGGIVLGFLSRISRKKNLDGALNLLNGLQGEVYFRVYGPIEDRSYWQACLEIISRLPAMIRVEYRGELQHDDVEAALFDCDALLFPTRGENYGYVILEALSAGCPVIISDQTPWRDLESKGIGWDLPLQEPERFQQVLQGCIDMPPEHFSEWSYRARQYAQRHTDDGTILNQTRRLFRKGTASVAACAEGAARL
jgi:glycosyltransferase involved in cell wall biosynthesis